MEVRERIAYIRGLLEASEGEPVDPKAQAVWDNLLEVCDSLAESVSALQSDQDDLEEYVYGIDADLCDLEDEIYGFSEELSGESETYDVPADEVETGDDLDDDDYVRAECQRCGEEVYFEESFLYDDDVEISCPECGEILYRSSKVFADENGEYVDGQVSAGSQDDESPAP